MIIGISTPVKYFIAILLYSFYSLTAYAEELRIGTTLSLTGAYAHYGQSALNGMTLAIESVNNEGGINGKQVRLIVEDFGTLDLKAANRAAQKLIHQDRVDILLPLIVEDGEVVIPLSTRARIFSMVIGCGARSCGTSLGTFNVRAPSSHDEIVESLINHAILSGTKHACIVAAQSTYFGAYGEYLKELAIAEHVSTHYQEVPLSNTSDYKEVALQFKQHNCDAIFAWIPIGSSGAFYKRVRESGSKATIYGIVEADDPGVVRVAGEAAEGVVFATFAAPSSQFMKRYMAAYHEAPARPAVPAYDGTKLLLSLVKTHGTDPEVLMKEFSKIKDVPAENGVLTYSSTGERTGEQVVLMHIRDGKAQLLRAK